MENSPIDFRRLLLVIIALAVAVLNGCDEEEKVLPASIIQFATSLQNVAEGGEVAIQLILDKPARQNSSVDLAFETNAVLGENFQTSPSATGSILELFIEQGMKEPTFTVKCMDNLTIDNGKYIVFKLKNPGPALTLGTLSTNTLILGDDESPAFANFSTTGETVIESSTTGVEVTISFSNPTIDDGIIKLTFNGVSVYGKDFVTNPPVKDNFLTLEVEKDQNDVSFTILPIDNDVLSGNADISFTITIANGAIQKGKIISQMVTIVDDEVPSEATFKVTGWTSPECDDSGDCGPSMPLSGGTVIEDQQAGIFVPIELSQPATGTGKISISWKDSGYGTTFTTIPPASQPYSLIELPITKGDHGSGFTVVPINNNAFTDGSNVTFEIAGLSGVVRPGTNLRYLLTISDDEVPSFANFPKSPMVINELDAAGIMVEVSFSEPTHGSGSITVNFDTDDATFSTEPSRSSDNTINWDLGSNETGINFRIKPTDNSVCGNSTVFFWITSSGFIKPGERSNYRVTFVDDEASIATFDVDEATVAEDNTSGKLITINFSKPVSMNSTMHLVLGDCNGKVATSPPSECYQSDLGGESQLLALNVPKDATSTQFTILPVNDSNRGGNYGLQIYPWIVGNGCLQFAPDSKYNLTILEDD